jgi:hypothetical protein
MQDLASQNSAKLRLLYFSHVPPLLSVENNSTLLKMASALLVEGLEAGEAAEAGEAFEQDSDTNAQAGGVVTQGIGSLLNLGLAIHDLIRNEKKLAQEDEDRMKRRYSLGIVYPSESRDDLVNKGLIPSYYSKSEIRSLIYKMKLPFAWSLQTTVNQGFGNEVRSMLFKKSLESQSEDLVKRLTRERELKRAIQGADNIRRKLRLNRFLESSAANIM